MKKKRSVSERFFYVENLAERKNTMGLGKGLKKIGKQMASAVTNPKMLINPNLSVTELASGVRDERRREKAEENARAESLAAAETEAANRAFEDELDRNRRASKRTNVVFGGMLGDDGAVGLGGRKNLLGL